MVKNQKIKIKKNQSRRKENKNEVGNNPHQLILSLKATVHLQLNYAVTGFCVFLFNYCGNHSRGIILRIYKLAKKR